jgi:ankyrin repeat protein
VELLLRQGSSVHERDGEGQTVLFQAVQSKDPVLVELLLKKGADANARDSRGRTVLQLALRKGGKTARVLLNNGAKLTTDPADSMNHTRNRERLHPSSGLWPDRVQRIRTGEQVRLTATDVAYWN